MHSRIVFYFIESYLTFRATGDKFFTFNESEGNPSGTKELNISTLRRKLFSQGDPSPGTEASNVEGNEIEINNNQRPE